MQPLNKAWVDPTGEQAVIVVIPDYIASLQEFARIHGRVFTPDPRDVEAVSHGAVLTANRFGTCMSIDEAKKFLTAWEEIRPA